MGLKKSIDNCIRGWLPKEPILPRRAAPSQTKPGRVRAFFLDLAVGFLVIAGLFCFVLLLSNTWIKISLISISLVVGALWLISHDRMKSAIKFTLAMIMIFSIAFASVEGYLLWNGGYPATYASTEPKVTLSVQKMLNTSVEQIVQSAKNNPTFDLLRLEYGNSIIFEELKLWPSNGAGGYIAIDFASGDSKDYFHVYSSDGHQYIVQPMTYSGELMSEHYPSSQTTEMAFKQIDALGLNWFYNKALEVAQNRTANLPTVDSVDITVLFGEGLGSYQGITLQLIGYHQNILPNGIIDGQGCLDFRVRTKWHLDIHVQTVSD